MINSKEFATAAGEGKGEGDLDGIRRRYDQNDPGIITSFFPDEKT